MSASEWKRRLDGRMAPDLAKEIDLFEGQVELRRQGKIEEAISCYNEALKRNKDNDKVCTAPSGRTACVTLPSLDVKQKYSEQTGKSLVAIDGLAKGKCRGVA